jgi:hypothetical protein
MTMIMSWNGEVGVWAYKNSISEGNGDYASSSRSRSSSSNKNKLRRLFLDCDIRTYYSTVRDDQNSGWIMSKGEDDIRTELALLLQKTHRQILSMTSTDDSTRNFRPDASSSSRFVGHALQDLDATKTTTGSNVDHRPNEHSQTVHMIFTQTEMDADALGIGWEPQYLWPIIITGNTTAIQTLASDPVDDGTMTTVALDDDSNAWRFAQSDLHNLKPQHIMNHHHLEQDADGVTLQNLFYGICDPCDDYLAVVDPSSLFPSSSNVIFHQKPSVEISANQNDDQDPLLLCLCAKEEGSWQPPPEARGEIARAMLYMELRYGTPTTASNGLGLTLSDCRPSPASSATNTTNNDHRLRMGYFSQLVQWHLEYPPTSFEQERNDKVCRLYQGNRNPFVDFPEDSWSLLPFDRVDKETCWLSPEDDSTTNPTHDIDDDDDEVAITTPTIPPKQQEQGKAVDVNKEDENQNKRNNNEQGRFDDTSTTATISIQNPCDQFMPGDINFNMIDASTNSFGLVALVDVVPEGLELFVTNGIQEQQHNPDVDDANPTNSPLGTTTIKVCTKHLTMTEIRF